MIRQRLINVCLVPDRRDPRAAEIERRAVAFSSALNERSPSVYRLSDAPGAQSRDDSFAHCTLMHFRVPDDVETLSAVGDALAPILGRPVEVQITGGQEIESKAFIRDEILAGGEGVHPARVAWLAVQKSSELEALQGSVVRALEGALQGRSHLLTPRGSAYAPHFTCWADFENAPFPSERGFRGEPPVGNVRCRVALGDCGPVGQVRSFEASRR